MPLFGRIHTVCVCVCLFDDDDSATMNNGPQTCFYSIHLDNREIKKAMCLHLRKLQDETENYAQVQYLNVYEDLNTAALLLNATGIGGEWTNRSAYSNLRSFFFFTAVYRAASRCYQSLLFTN
jgi:hypothetical protein